MQSVPHSLTVELLLMPFNTPTVCSYGLEASMIDGLPAGAASAVRSAVLQACSNQHLVIDEVVIGARSVVVTHPSANASLVLDLLNGLDVDSAATAPLRNPATVVIPVHYDGEDLAHIALHCHLSIPDVIALHSSTRYVVEFCGFSPGFAYLAGLPSALTLPRRTSPRTRVPRGAVAIAAGYCAVYPRESPGGWHLIGVTDFDVWNITRTQPAALTPGAIVQFVEIT